MERSSKKKSSSSSEKQAVPAEPRTVVFFHPDLGIGGAERLVVDAAVGLQERGDKIVIFTSHRDVHHCFDETKDGTLDVRVRGDTVFPATILGRFKILCTILRQLHLLYAITWSGELAKIKPTVFFVDQLSAGIPFLRWYWEDVKILFYCHFPDLLLVHGRKSWYKRLWRIPFDWLEGWGMRGADRVVVNSEFTRGKVEEIWHGLGSERGVGVVYPCVDTTDDKLDGDHPEDVWPGKKILLSINRFERKKNASLAIEAFAGLKAKERTGIRLVIAGGYDTRVPENITCHKELEALAAGLKLKTATAKNVVSAQAVPDDIEVLFLLSVPSQLKASLLRTAKILLYTPPDEHFGIVPLEAMLVGVPVLAANSGGPLETIIDGQTGWLRSVDDVQQWTDTIRHVLYDLSDANLAKMSEISRKRVLDEFSKTQMANRLDKELTAMIKAPRVRATELADLLLAVMVIGTAIGSMIVVLLEVPKSSSLPKDLRAVGLFILVLFAAPAAIVATVWKLRQQESGFR